MADNNSKTFISGIVIFAVLVILGFTFFAGKEETAPVITDGVVVDAPASLDEVESSEDAAVELDQIVPVTEAPVAVEETVEIEETAPVAAEDNNVPATQETTVDEAVEAVENAGSEAVDAVQDAAQDAQDAIENAVDNVDVQPAEEGMPAQ